MGFFDFLKSKKQRAYEAAMAEARGERQKNYDAARASLAAERAGTTEAATPSAPASDLDAMLARARGYSRSKKVNAVVDGYGTRKDVWRKEWIFVERAVQDNALDELLSVLETQRHRPEVQEAADTYLSLVAEKLAQDVDLCKNSHGRNLVSMARHLPIYAERVQNFCDAVCKYGFLDMGLEKSTEAIVASAHGQYGRAKKALDGSLQFCVDELRQEFDRAERGDSQVRRNALAVIDLCINQAERMCKDYNVPEPVGFADWRERADRLKK
jgi:hypothetical protein